MDNMDMYITEEGQSPNADVEPTNDLHEMETVKLKNAESSNEDNEEEPGNGQQDREEVDNIKAEMDEPEGKRKHLSKVDVAQKNYSEGELRIMNELRKLSPAVLAADIARHEKMLYQLALREAREITRSKHLETFFKNKRRFSK